MSRIHLAFALAVTGGAVAAQETRELDAHEHGVGLFNVAISGGEVAMELEAPGMDIVGFEHPSATAEDQARIDAAVATLAEPLELFALPAAAECVVTEASAGLVEEHEHGDEAAEGAAHAEGEDDHAAEEALAEDHDGEAHTEFWAEYRLTCANPAAIDGIDFAYFAAFSNAREMEVQLVSDTGAQRFEVTRDAPRLDLAGSM